MRKVFTQWSLAGICLMSSLQPTVSAAYPGGAAVSYGQNPLWSAGGSVTGTDTIAIRTAPAGQTLVVTDVHLSLADDESDWNCMTRWTIDLQAGTETTLGSFTLVQYRHYSDGDSWTHGESVARATFSSGLPVPAGEVLNLVTDLRGTYDCSSSPRVHYTLSGYIAQG